MKTFTSDIYKFSRSSKIALALTSVFAAAGFTWPFFASDMESARFAQYFFWVAMPLAFALLLTQLSDRSLDAKSVALLGMLAALLAALRPLGAGAIGIEPMWFLLILAARVFGSAFGGGSFGGSRSGGGSRTVRGTNLRVKMKLNLDDIANGVKKKIKVNKLINADGVTYKSCSTCNGTGRITRVAQTFLGAMQTQSACHVCQGAGKMIDKKPSDADAQGLKRQEEVIEIEIPAGV